METQGDSVQPVSDPAQNHKKKILLLEDDEQLSEIIKEFLVMYDYQVISVSNGVEGVREIIAGDFDVIVCDMMMPKLAGDMFYLAVERMRPYLCERFIFITGQHGNAKVINFINKVGGLMLAKPFPMNDLLDLAGFVQLRDLTCPAR
ncbi:MAG: response regulator [Verrucomicrobiota bacterium]